MKLNILFFLLHIINIAVNVMAVGVTTHPSSKDTPTNIGELLKKYPPFNESIYSRMFDVNKEEWTMMYKSYTIDNMPVNNESIVLSGNEKYAIHLNFTNDSVKIVHKINVNGVNDVFINTSIHNGGFVVPHNYCCSKGAGPGRGYFNHGAGHGGKGGGHLGEFGQKYNDNDILLGGSTGARMNGSNPGTGGGVIIITSKKKFMLGFLGKLSANGYDVSNSTFQLCSGGSSGGYISIHAFRIVLSGSITANGGNSGYSSFTNAFCGDGGGGGVIKLNALKFSINRYPIAVGGKGLENGENGLIWIGSHFETHLLIDTDTCYLRSNDFNMFSIDGMLHHITGYNLKICEIEFQNNLKISSGVNIRFRGANSLKIKVINGSFELRTDLHLETYENILDGHSVLGGYHNLGSYNGPGNNTDFALHGSTNRSNYGINPFKLIGGSSCQKDDGFIPTVGGGAIEIEAVNGDVILGGSIYADSYEKTGTYGALLQLCGASGGAIKIQAKKIKVTDPSIVLSAKGGNGLKGGDGGVILLAGMIISDHKNFMDVSGGRGYLPFDHGHKGYILKTDIAIEPKPPKTLAPTQNASKTKSPLEKLYTTTVTTISSVEVITVPPTKRTNAIPNTHGVLPEVISNTTTKATKTQATTQSCSTAKITTKNIAEDIIDEAYKNLQKKNDSYNETKVINSLKRLAYMNWETSASSEVASVLEEVVNISSQVLTNAVEESNENLETTVVELKNILESFGSFISKESSTENIYTFSKPRIDMEVSVVKVHDKSDTHFPQSNHEKGSLDNIITLSRGFASEQTDLKENSLLPTTSIILDVSNKSKLLQSNSTEGGEQILSSIFSFTIHAVTREPFRVPILLTQKFNNQGNENGKIRAGYRNITEGIWKFNGMFTKAANSNYITTECTHLTSFAVLVQVRDIEIADVHRKALSIITYIGCSLSLFACLVTYAVLVTIRSVSSERVRIHRNLVMALGIALTFFVIGIELENNVLCTIVAVILHYFFTAVFGWMFAEGVHLYTKVVRVFSAGRSNMKIYHFLGWGIPVIFVAISAGINPGGYGANGVCWISTEGGMIWSFIAPVVFVVLLNVCIMMRVLRILVSSVNGPLDIKSDKSKQQIKVALKGMVLLLPILGLTWIFGMLAVNEATMFFQYIFCILNSFQGVLIFLLYCIGNSEVRAALQRLREKHFGSKFSSHSKSISDSEGSEMKKRQTKNTNGKKTVIRLNSPEEGTKTPYTRTISTDFNTH